MGRCGDGRHDRSRAVVRLRQGGVYWAEAQDKRRPVLVVTRPEGLPCLSALTVAPVTRTVRGIPTEIPLGAGEGLPAACAATFDNLQLVSRSRLTERIGLLSHPREQICRALAALADC